MILLMVKRPPSASHLPKMASEKDNATENMESGQTDPLIQFEHTYESAIALTGVGRFHYILLLVTGLSMMSVAIESHSMAFVLPAAKCELQLSGGQQGLAYAIGYVGVVLGSHLWGFLADTWGRRNVLRLALFGCFATSALSSLALNSWMLLGSRFLVGCWVAGIKGTGISYLSEFHSNANRPRHLSFLASISSMSSIVQSLIALAIMTRPVEWTFMGHLVYRSWRMCILAYSCVSGLAALGICCLPESPKFLLSMQRTNYSVQILRSIHAQNTGGSKPYAVERLQPLEESGSSLNDVTGCRRVLSLIWNQTWPLFVQPYRKPLLIVCSTVFLIFFTCHGALMWFPQVLTYYTDYRNSSLTTCAAISRGNSAMQLVGANQSSVPVATQCNPILDASTFSVTFAMGMTFVICNTLVGLSMKRFGNELMLTGWLSVNSMAALLLVWSTVFHLNSLLMILLISTVSCSTILCGIFGTLFPTHLRGMAMNLIVMCSRLGSLCGSIFLSAMLFRFCDILYGLNALILLGTTIVTYLMLRKCKNVSGLH